MSTRKPFTAVAAAALMLCFGTARAGGAIAGATEPTQIMNNLELVKVAVDGAKTASTTVSKYMLQIQQYQTQVNNLMKLPSLPAGLGMDVLKAYNDLSRYKSALAELQGSLSQQEQAIESRVTEARLSGRGWEAYLADQQAAANMHQGRAIERLKYEEQVLQQVQSDYDFARNLQSQIPNTVGQHQSLQMLNSQMNRVITQNGKLLEVVSATIKSGSEDDARKAETMTQSMADRELMRQRQNAIETRQRAFGGWQQ